MPTRFCSSADTGCGRSNPMTIAPTGQLKWLSAGAKNSPSSARRQKAQAEGAGVVSTSHPAGISFVKASATGGTASPRLRTRRSAMSEFCMAYLPRLGAPSGIAPAQQAAFQALGQGEQDQDEGHDDDDQGSE